MNWGNLEPHWLWLIGGLLLAIAEMLVPGVFLIWIGVAALVTGAATWAFGLGEPSQFALFAVLAIASVVIGRKYFRQHPIDSDDPLLNDRTARVMGEIVVVTQPIVNGHGRVRLGDGEWNARGPDAEVGARVRIVGSDGAVLAVEPV